MKQLDRIVAWPFWRKSPWVFIPGPWNDQDDFSMIILGGLFRWAGVVLLSVGLFGFALGMSGHFLRIYLGNGGLCLFMGVGDEVFAYFTWKRRHGKKGGAD